MVSFKSGSFDFCDEQVGFSDWQTFLDREDRESALDDPTNYLGRLHTNTRKLMEATPLRLRFNDSKEVSKIVEDIRLFEYEEEIWVSACHGGGVRKAWPCLGRIESGTSEVVLHRIEDPDLQPPQKNWLPFQLGNDLYLTSHLCPHRVVRVSDSGRLLQVWQSEPRVPAYLRPFFLRCSAAPIPLGGDSYLGAGHIVLFPGIARSYLHFFYEMDSKPPFQIRRFSKPFKILNNNDRVQFLMNMAWRHSKLVLSFGVCDCDSLFVEVAPEEIVLMFN